MAGIADVERRLLTEEEEQFLHDVHVANFDKDFNNWIELIENYCTTCSPNNV